MKMEVEEKKSNIIQWIIYGILIPLLFAAVLFIIILTISGINIFEEGKKLAGKIPFVGNFFEQQSQDDVFLEYEKKIGELEAKLRNEEAAKKKLQNELEEKEEKLKKLELENNQLEKEIEQLNNQETNNQLSDIVKTYEKMSPKQAALILIEMEEKMAVDILRNLKGETKAAILEKMPPKQAARFTSLLANKE